MSGEVGRVAGEGSARDGRSEGPEENEGDFGASGGSTTRETDLVGRDEDGTGWVRIRLTVAGDLRNGYGVQAVRGHGGRRRGHPSRPHSEF